jgi:hypothetical protein
MNPMERNKGIMKRASRPAASCMSLVLFTAACLLPAPAGAAADGFPREPGLQQHAPELFPPALFAAAGGSQKNSDSLRAEGKRESLRPQRPSPYVRSFSTARAHQFMGYGTMLLAALTAVTNSEHDVHRAASYATLWLAGATCATGFSGYRNFIDLSDGISADDAHAMLGTLGTIGFAATLVIAEAEDDDEGHGGIGAASTVAMGASLLVLQIHW